MKTNRFRLTSTLLFLSVCGMAAFANAQAIAGCDPTAFIDGTESNQIGTTGLSFTPKCLRVKVGASVTIAASSHHPLTAMPDINQARNPFGGVMSAVEAQTRTMSTPGLFGYFCEAHGDAEGDGMAGVIWVVP